MHVPSPRITRLAIALAVIAAILMAAPLNAADLAGAVSNANSQISSAKSTIATLAGSILGLVGLVYTAIFIGKYMKDHQMDHLVKIGAGIIAMAVGIALIATF